MYSGTTEPRRLRSAHCVYHHLIYRSKENIPLYGSLKPPGAATSWALKNSMKAAAGARASHVRASPYRNRNSGGACHSTVIYDGALREAFTVPGGAEPLGRLMSPEVEEAAI